MYIANIALCNTPTLQWVISCPTLKLISSLHVKGRNSASIYQIYILDVLAKRSFWAMTDLSLTSHLTIKATRYKGSSRTHVHCSVAACVKYKYITTLNHTKYPNRIKIIMKAAKSICRNNQRAHSSSSVKIFF